MSQKPTLKQLTYLCSVADCKHFGNAARACHVSQSTLSAGINELEDSLGIPLIERNNKRVMLTTTGQEVVRRAQAILTEVNDLMATAVAAREPFSNTMRMGVIPTIAPFILPKLFSTLRKSHPKFQLLIREDLSANLATRLRQGELDIILLAFPYPMEGCETQHLFYDPFVLAYDKNHPLKNIESLHAKDLAGQDLLLLEEGHCLREHVLEACKLNAKEISVPYHATSLNTIVQMVANGIGITLLPKMCLNTNILSGTGIRTRALKDKKVWRSIGLAWRKNSPHQQEFERLAELLQQQHAVFSKHNS